MGQSWSAKRGGNTMKGLIFISLFFTCYSDFTGVARGGGRNQLARSGRQEEPIPGGVDFSGCVTDPDTGLCCVDKEETVTKVEREDKMEPPIQTEYFLSGGAMI